MITISLCMIVKNEEKNLPRCLNSIKDVVDEIIIVDTGSEDKTKEIAKKYTDKVYDFVWINDFSAARNFAFSKASKQYCMWLDADDVLPDKEKFLKLKESLNLDIDMVMLKYNASYDENNLPLFTYYRERIVANNKNYRFQGAIHEAITPKGKIIYSDVEINHLKTDFHYSDRNLRIFENLIKEKKNLSPREQFYYARELTYNNRDLEAIKIFNEFLNSKDGWVENKIEACKNLAECYYRTNEIDLALKSLFNSFIYDLPRAEICCTIGNIYTENGLYEKAIYYYKLALIAKKDETKGGFIINECYDYLPYIELCLCYYKIGEIELSKMYNEEAGKIKPYSKAYLYNKEFFNNLKKE